MFSHLKDPAHVAAFRAAARGDFDGMDALRARLAGSRDVGAVGLQLLAGYMDYFAGRTPAAPVLGELAELATSPAYPALADFAAKEALLRHDNESFVALRPIVNDGDVSTLSHVFRAWSGYLHGNHQGALESAQHARAMAKKAGDADTVIDSTALEALALLSTGDVEGSLSIARRAVRMARTEQMPQQLYLAAIVLARVRRCSRHAYLASRILAGLRRVAPPPWRTWIAWEQVLCGSASDLPAATPAAQLSRCLALASAGDRSEWESSCHKLVAALAGEADRLQEIRDLRACVDPLWAGDSCSLAAADWIRCDDVAPPRGFEGLCSSDVAFVTFGGGVTPRRWLAPGKGLETRATILEGNERRADRVELGILTLALAPNHRLTEEDFFHSVYGFDYERGTHVGVLDSLMRRMREHLHEKGSVGRSDGWVSLSVGETVAVPDPRCAISVDAHILKMMAANPGSTARDAAETLGVALRTVQLSLKGLVDTGACTTERKGRKIVYRVEDTTFMEPTQLRKL